MISLSQQGCNCEPCPIDLTVVFPGAQILYEDPAFSQTRCKWHWIARSKRAKHMTIAPSGAGKDGTLYLWVDGLSAKQVARLDSPVVMKPSECGRVTFEIAV